MLAWLRVALSRIKSAFAKERLDREFDEELQTHLELLTEEYRSRGITSSEARRAACQKLGHPGGLREANREERGLPVLETLAADTRYAVRTALQKPGFTLIAVISLGLGLGANTALFSLVNHLLLQSLPVKEPDQLVQVQRVVDLGGGRVKATGFSTGDLEIIARNSNVFSDILGFFNLDRPVVTIGGVMAPPVRVEQVSDGFFRTLGVAMAIGVSQGNVPGAVISYRFWHTRFDGKVNVLGGILDIDGHSYTIAGVAPSQFLGLELENSPDIWIWSNAPSTSYEMVGRLRPSVSSDQARTATEALFQ